MVFFRYWNFTTCIDFNNLDVLEQKINKLLEEEEDCFRLSQLPQLDFEPKQLRLNYPEEKLPNLWIIALFKSNNEWITIKTFPTGILCERSFNATRPRLSYLTERLNCNAFHLEVHEDDYGYLLETDASGHIALSGSPGADYPDNFKFYNEPKVNQPDFIQQFSLIDVPESMQAAIRINESPEVKKQEAEIQKLEQNGSPEYYELIQDVPGYTERIDHAMADLFDPQGNYWFIRSTLAYKVYQEPQELELVGARLLYFHPPSSYQPLTKPKSNYSYVDQNISPQSEDELPF